MSSTVVQLCLSPSESKNESDNEELLLNTIATINNLSFYNTKQSAVVRKQLHIAECEYFKVSFLSSKIQ